MYMCVNDLVGKRPKRVKLLGHSRPTVTIPSNQAREIFGRCPSASIPRWFFVEKMPAVKKNYTKFTEPNQQRRDVTQQEKFGTEAWAIPSKDTSGPWALPFLD